MTIAEKLLPEFDDEFAMTRKMLALVPDEKLTWKPHEKSMNVRKLAWHLADFPSWCTMTITKDRLEMTPEEGEKLQKAAKSATRADMLKRFDQDLAEARAALAATSDAAMAKHWKMEWGGQTIIDSPKLDVYRKWCINHMVHHRAQLGVYLRLLGIAIPGCYGPSADEMPAQAAAD
jgi:uncharacterized damage-inducible protein DinB